MSKVDEWHARNRRSQRRRPPAQPFRRGDVLGGFHQHRRTHGEGRATVKRVTRQLEQVLGRPVPAREQAKMGEQAVKRMER